MLVVSVHRNLSMHQVSSSTVFFFVSYMHNTCPLYNVLLEVVCCCFPRLLNMPMFVGSHSFISPPSFMLVSAVVSEIRKLNQNKKEEEEEEEEEEFFNLLFPIFHLSRAYNLPIF